jgi:hypothetical protein
LSIKKYETFHGGTRILLIISLADYLCVGLYATDGKLGIYFVFGFPKVIIEMENLILNAAWNANLRFKN